MNSPLRSPRGAAAAAVALLVLCTAASGSGRRGRSPAGASPVAGADVEALWAKGHAVLPGVFAPAELARMRSAVEEAAAGVVRACLRCPGSDDVGDPQCRGCERTAATPARQPKSFVKARNLHRTSAGVRAIAKDPRIMAMAAELLKVGRVRLYHDTAFFKEVGDVESSWHQDQAAAPLDTDKFVTLWIPLEDVDQTQGTLMFADGSHLAQTGGLSMRGVPLGDRIGQFRQLTDAEVASGFSITGPGSLQAGSLSAHLGWTLHRAPPNTGRRPRRALALTYYADGAAVYEDVFVFKSDRGQDPGAAEATAPRGIEFASVSETVVVQLLSDDVSTWIPWAMDGWMVPGQALAPPPAIA